MAQAYKGTHWYGPKAYLTYPITYMKNSESPDASSRILIAALLEEYHETRYQLKISGKVYDAVTIKKPVRDILLSMGYPVKTLQRDGVRGRPELTITVMTDTKPPELKEIAIRVQIHKICESGTITAIQIRLTADDHLTLRKYIDGVKLLLIESGIKPTSCEWTAKKTFKAAPVKPTVDKEKFDNGQANLKKLLAEKDQKIRDLQDKVDGIEKFLYRASAQEDRKVRQQVLR